MKARILITAATLMGVLTLSGGPALASGGTGGGGTGGGGGSTVPATSVVSYSNLGPTDVIPTLGVGSGGWGLTGSLTSFKFNEPVGYFDDLSFQFSPTATGSIASIRLAVQRTVNGGSDGYTVYLYTDNATTPNTIGNLVGTFQGRSAKIDAASPLSAIAVTNGPIIQAGVNYWIKVVPAADSWSTWYSGPANVYGWHFFETNVLQYYFLDSATGGIGVQGAFEIKVTP